MARQRTYDDSLRERLVDEAALVIADRGVQALSVRDVAMRAGTTTNAIYTFFGSRDNLIAEVVAKADESFIAAHRDAAGDGEDLVDLYRIGKAYVLWALEHPTLYVILTDRMRARKVPPPWAPHIEHDDRDGGAPLVVTVSNLMERGILKKGDPVLLSTYLWAAAHGYVEVLRMLAGQEPEGYDLVQYLHAIITPWVATNAKGELIIDLDTTTLSN